MVMERLINELNLTDLTQNADAMKQISGVYIGDLLSYVMSKAQKDQVWITVQININIVAVAVLCEVACILIPEGIKVGAEVLNKAKAENVVILSSKDTSYDFIVKYSRIQ